MHPNQISRGPLPIHEDYRASTFPSAHVGKGQAVKQLHKSIGAGNLRQSCANGSAKNMLIGLFLRSTKS
jgi:hypothetical protein